MADSTQQLLPSPIDVAAATSSTPPHDVSSPHQITSPSASPPLRPRLPWKVKPQHFHTRPLAPDALHWSVVSPSPPAMPSPAEGVEGMESLSLGPAAWPATATQQQQQLDLFALSRLPSDRLYVHNDAIQSVLRFMELPELHMALQISHQWNSAVKRMARMPFHLVITAQKQQQQSQAQAHRSSTSRRSSSTVFSAETSELIRRIAASALAKHIASMEVYLSSQDMDSYKLPWQFPTSLRRLKIEFEEHSSSRARFLLNPTATPATPARAAQDGVVSAARVHAQALLDALGCLPLLEALELSLPFFDPLLRFSGAFVGTALASKLKSLSLFWADTSNSAALRAAQLSEEQIIAIRHLTNLKYLSVHRGRNQMPVELLDKLLVGVERKEERGQEDGSNATWSMTPTPATDMAIPAAAAAVTPISSPSDSSSSLPPPRWQELGLRNLTDGHTSKLRLLPSLTSLNPRCFACSNLDWLLPSSLPNLRSLCLRVHPSGAGKLHADLLVHTLRHCVQLHNLALEHPRLNEAHLKALLPCLPSLVELELLDLPELQRLDFLDAGIVPQLARGLRALTLAHCHHPSLSPADLRFLHPYTALERLRLLQSFAPPGLDDYSRCLLEARPSVLLKKLEHFEYEPPRAAAGGGGDGAQGTNEE